MANNKDTATFEVFNASAYKVGIVVAQFNKTLCDAMLEEAHKECARYGVLEKNIKIYKVAGSVEIPVILQKLAATKKYDCLIAIGVIIRGETAHFEYVANMVTDGILRVQLDNAIPIGLGVLTVLNVVQAKARLDVGKGAVEAALQSAKTLKSI